MRKAILWTIASLLLIAGIALYVITRPIPTETFTLHFVDGISGAPLTNGLEVDIHTFRDSLTLRLSDFMSELEIPFPKLTGLQYEFFGSNDYAVVEVKKSDRFETGVKAKAPHHFTALFQYSDGSWRGTNQAYFRHHAHARHPIYRTTNGVLYIPLFPRPDVWDNP